MNIVISFVSSTTFIKVQGTSKSLCPIIQEYRRGSHHQIIWYRRAVWGLRSRDIARVCRCHQVWVRSRSSLRMLRCLCCGQRVGSSVSYVRSRCCHEVLARGAGKTNAHPSRQHQKTNYLMQKRVKKRTQTNIFQRYKAPNGLKIVTLL